MVIILAWIIRSGHKYDRAVRRYAGDCFPRGSKIRRINRTRDYWTIKNCYAVTVELVVPRGGKYVEQFSISDQCVGRNFLGSAINIARHFDGYRQC